MRDLAANPYCTVVVKARVAVAVGVARQYTSTDCCGGSKVGYGTTRTNFVRDLLALVILLREKDDRTDTTL